MTNYSNSITPGMFCVLLLFEISQNFETTIEFCFIFPGIQLGKENGLSLLLDAEVYDYAFSPQKGEGFKLAIHSHMDQPIMALSDIDLSPGMSINLEELFG